MFSADGRGHLINFSLAFFVCTGLHRSTGPNWSETQSQTASLTYEDLRSLYRYLHQQKIYTIRRSTCKFFYSDVCVKSAPITIRPYLSGDLNARYTRRRPPTK